MTCCAFARCLFTALDLRSVTAIILANLCVAYVMTSANEEAEELMRLVEREEEKAKDPTKSAPALNTSIPGHKFNIVYIVYIVKIMFI